MPFIIHIFFLCSGFFRLTLVKSLSTLDIQFHSFIIRLESFFQLSLASFPKLLLLKQHFLLSFLQLSLGTFIVPCWQPENFGFRPIQSLRIKNYSVWIKDEICLHEESGEIIKIPHLVKLFLVSCLLIVDNEFSFKRPLQGNFSCQFVLEILNLSPLELR